MVRVLSVVEDGDDHALVTLDLCGTIEQFSLLVVDYQNGIRGFEDPGDLLFKALCRCDRADIPKHIAKLIWDLREGAEITFPVLLPDPWQ